MKTKYSKNHPLWPVWDLQRQILKRGGKIDRHSDLLAFYEGRSLNPGNTPIYYLKNLAKNDKYCSGLIKKRTIGYKKNFRNRFGLDTPFYTYTYILPNERMPEGYNINPDSEFNDSHKSTQEYNLHDNEFIIRSTFSDTIIIIDPKYIDILKLIKNGYSPQKEEMKQNKNLLPAIIIALGLIIAALIYAFSNRYEVEGYLRYDKWTGTMEKFELKR